MEANHFWNQLLTITDLPTEIPSTELRAALLGIEEGFSGVFDPADHFQEYVALSLCRYVGQVIEREASTRNDRSIQLEHAKSSIEGSGGDR